MTTAHATKHPYIIKDPKIQGGKAVIAGTRIPVSTIIVWYHMGFDIQEILDKYPQLSPSEVYDALSYYYDHKDEIDAERKEQEEDSNIKKRYPPGKP